MGKLRELMEMWAELEAFKRHLVKVVFRDGDNVIAKRGELVSVTDNFIELHTFDNAILIRISEVLKIQRSLNERDQDKTKGPTPHVEEAGAGREPPSTVRTWGKEVK